MLAIIELRLHKGYYRDTLFNDVIGAVVQQKGLQMPKTFNSVPRNSSTRSDLEVYS